MRNLGASPEKDMAGFVGWALWATLHGHPESGAHWQNHLEEAVRKLGGKTVEGHPSTFFFEQRDLALTVYVDDLLLAGLGRFLGRHHEIVEAPDGLAVAFNIREYIRSAVDMYLGITKQQRLKGAATTFLQKGSILPDEWEQEGQLQTHACAILMKLLWGARLGRPDMLKAITFSASHVSKWCRACDRMLHRLLCYAHHSVDFTLVGQITDVPANVWLELYDFAGDSDSALSTNGGWLTVAGSNGTSWPLYWKLLSDRLLAWDALARREPSQVFSFCEVSVSYDH